MLFYRYSMNIHDEMLCHVQPLRVRVGDFQYSKRHRRNIVRNRDLMVWIRPSVIDDRKHALFQKHITRFAANQPGSLFDFLSPCPGTIPCRNLEFGVYAADQLVAVSFLDIGETAVSSVYAMFDPDFARRGLGIYTALLELEYARANAMQYYYIGYAYDVPSHYDYKKQFSATEQFDWQGSWLPLTGAKER